MQLSGNIIKNVKGVTVPNSGGLKGIDVAAVLGVVGGNADKALEVLEEIRPEHIEKTKELVENVPNSGGLKGIDVAAVLGVVGGNADKALEVLEEIRPEHIEKTKELVEKNICSCTLVEGVANLYIVVVGGNADKALEVLEEIRPEHIEKTKELVEKNICSCTLVEGVANLYIVARVIKGSHFAEITIVDQHTNITKIVKDDQVLLSKEVKEEEVDSVIDKSKLTVKDILDFADQVKIGDVKEILERQIRMNTAISQEGLDNNYGAQIGKTLMHVWGKGITTRACARAAAGSDARMGGCSMPVVINSGSGNQGMTVSLPVIAYAEEWEVSREKLYRSLVVSNLIAIHQKYYINSGSGNQGMTVSLPVIAYAEEWEVSREKLYRSLVVSNLIAIHQKYYIGSLSAYCGAVSAACGAGAGITYMYGGSYQQVSLTIINTLGNIGGIVCDGAKPSCAAKIASSVDAALMAFHLSIQNKSFLPGEGIIARRGHYSRRCGRNHQKYGIYRSCRHALYRYRNIKYYDRPCKCRSGMLMQRLI